MRGWRRTNFEGYGEKHHIIPKCLKGGNEKPNIVKLTAEEHFIAHLLLTKMYPDEGRLASVVFLMSHRVDGQKVKNNKIYGRLRESVARSFSAMNKGRISHNKGKTLSEEQKKHLSVINTGKKQTPETIEKRFKNIRGRKTGPKSQETKDKISNSLKGRKSTSPHPMKGKKIPEEHRLKIVEALYNRPPISEETRAKMSARAKARPPMTEETRLNQSLAQKRRFQKIKDKKEILQFWCAL